MKNIIKIILFTGAVLLFADCSKNGDDPNEQCYICLGPRSKAYHKNERCKGIEWCSKDHIKITVKEAKERYNRHKCSHCY